MPHRGDDAHDAGQTVVRRVSEHELGEQHRLDHRSVERGLFGFVDLRQRVGLDQSVEGEPAVLPQLDHSGDELLRIGVALEDADHGLAEECVGIENQLIAAGADQAAHPCRDGSGHTGVGQAVPLSSDTGAFWFFGASNLELVVKVLDGTAVNGKHWVFFAALSDVEYTVTVTDSLTGLRRTYHNPRGVLASAADTGAF